MSKFVLPAATAVSRAAQLDRTLYNGLRPVLIGPRAGLHRFDVTAEQAGIGAYDPLADHSYDYPNQTTGSVVDLTSVKLFAKTANLNYFSKFIGIDGSATALSTAPNEVRAANFVFQTANGVSRSAAFFDRDVKIGDIAFVRGTGDDTVVYELTTSVTGFVGEVVAASTGTATADANNVGSQSASASVVQVDSTPINDVVATVNGTPYNSSADGYINRVYTVTVTQSSTGGDATTGRLRVRSADGGDDQDNVVPAAFAAPTAIGTKGLTLTFAIDMAHSSSSGVDETDLLVGQAWTVTVAQAWTLPVATAAGTYSGLRTATYIVAVTRGGTYAGSTKPQITVTSDNGYDRSGPTDVTATATPVAVGQFGVTIQFTQAALRKGDTYYIAATAAGAGAIKTLVLQDDIDPEVRGNEVDIRLFAARTDLEIPTAITIPTDETIWTFDADGVTVNSGITLLDAEFTNAGVLVPVALDSADLYVQYREWLTATEIDLVTLTDPSGIPAAFGTVAAENPIAWAASFALGCTAGQLLADPTKPAAATTDRVFCIDIGGDPSDAALWTAALQLIEDNEEAYDIVPLTDDGTIQDLVKAHVDAQSTDAVGFYRRCLLSRPLVEIGAIVDAGNTPDLQPATATIAAKAGTSPPKYVIVTASANAKFVTEAVRAGDKLRINFGEDAFGATTYDSYTVAKVTSETTLELTTGPMGVVSPARQIEIWRTFTKDELVTQQTNVAAGYADSRVMLVFPDEPAFGGTVLEGYTLCAALAGLMGSVPSQQGLKNVGVPGFDDMTRASRFFTSAQLDNLATGGVLVVSQSPTGDVYVRSAVTTDPSTLALREEMITRNADMIRKAIQDEWAPYVGSGNVVSQLQDQLGGALASLSARLQSGNYPQSLGSPVGSLSVASLSAVDGHPDQVQAAITATGLALPLNQLIVNLPVSLG